MPPFVESNLASESNEEIPEDFNYELSLLIMAKKVGLSFDELNLFTLNDFIKYINLYVGNDEEQGATQDDINDFYAV